jgi:hypothetical protein
MRHRAKLTWMTASVVVLCGAGAAMAQSAPPDPSRDAAPGGTVAGGLVLPSGAGAPIPSKGAGADGLQMIHGDATGVTSTTAGQATRVVPVGDLPGGAASGGRARRADAVIRGQINPAAKSCYENDADSKSRQPGRLVLVIRLAPGGEVDSVTVASNAGLSPSVTSCITAAAGAARFGAPGPNGATVRAAFAFPRQDDPAPPAGARLKGAQAVNAGHAASAALARADGVPPTGQTPQR